MVQNHEQWTNTVSFAPDIISMTFIPIISLLEDLPGKRHLERAIDLYLECKFFFFPATYLISCFFKGSLRYLCLFDVSLVVIDSSCFFLSFQHIVSFVFHVFVSF